MRKGALVLFGNHFYGCADTAFGNGVAEGFKFVVFAFFNGVFSFIVDDISALFSLFGRMSAYFNKRFNNPFKGIHFIIPDNQAVR